MLVCYPSVILLKRYAKQIMNLLPRNIRIDHEY